MTIRDLRPKIEIRHDLRESLDKDDEAAQGRPNVEAYRRLLDSGRVQGMQRGILDQRATSGVQGTLPIAPGFTASDLMKFARPVPENNGDGISGSGTKLKCPFCERTYGYETNLRAHIRQRHQGIRVSCPYCPRTFTRNNTVRRHVQREHRHLVGRIPTKFGSTRVMPDPLTAAASAAAAVAVVQQQQLQKSQQPRSFSPPPSTSGGNHEDK